MQGVTVITSEEVMAYPDWMWIMTLLGLFGGVLCLFISGSLIENHKCVGTFFFVLFALGIISFILGSIFAASEKYDCYDYTKYYITVSEETSMLEFSEKYEVLKKHNDMWEVKEIQEDN